MDEKHIQTLIETEQRSKSNTHRIDDLENKTQSNNELALSVKELTVEIKYMREDYQKLAQTHAKEVQALDIRLAEIEKKPVKRYEQILSLIITRYSDSYIGLFFRPNRVIGW